MSLVRKEIIDGKKVEEYYWAGKMVVYVDDHAVTSNFDDTCNDIRTERDIKKDLDYALERIANLQKDIALIKRS